jgi:phage/plasmid-like protein (TIGR03299 family)
MHMIDVTTGRAAIAYKNDVPWHGLGQKVPEGAKLEDWAKLGGLDYEVRRSNVQFTPFDPTTTRGETNRITMPSRHVLYRSDTWKPMSVVGAGYQIVQPRDVLETFRDLVEISGFQMETVGALSDGARVWALARVGEQASITGRDFVKRYLMVATSYDTSMSTIVKFVDERVVCHNTITSALGESSRTFKVHHGKEFDPKAAKAFMGLGISTWDQYIHDMRNLAHAEMKRDQAEHLTMKLLVPVSADGFFREQDAIRETRGFKRVMSLFDNQIGMELTGGPSAWRWLNAVTQFVDWEKGVTPSSRMNSAWFGDGDAMKSRALKLVTA